MKSYQLTQIALCLLLASVSARAESNKGTTDQSLSSSVGLPSTAAIVRASKDSNEATAQIAKGFGGPDAQLFVAIKLATPVTKDTETANLGNLDGLTDSSTAELSLSPVLWRIESPDPLEMSRICQKYMGQKGCTRGELPDEQSKQEFDRAVIYGVPLFGRISVQVGRQKYTYVEDGKIDKTDKKKTPYSLNASFGAFFTQFGYVGASYRFERSFEAGDKTTLCQPYAVTGTTRCDSLVVGAPTKDTKNIARVEARWFARKFSVNPTVSYDFSDKVWGLQAPLYFIAGSDSAFIGGVNPSWRSDTKEFTATLFVGAALSTAPGL